MLKEFLENQMKCANSIRRQLLLLMNKQETFSAKNVFMKEWLKDQSLWQSLLKSFMIVIALSIQSFQICVENSTMSTQFKFKKDFKPKLRNSSIHSETKLMRLSKKSN